MNSADSGKMSADAKKSYAAPKLTTYGSVGELTMQMTAGAFPDANGMLMAMSSDPAYKESIVRIGTHPAGFGLYLFDYKAEYRDAFGHGRRFGVMADEVELVAPHAVVRGADGYRRVRYDMIGVHPVH